VTDQDDFDAAVLLPGVAPHVQAAIVAAAAHDLPTVGEAWRRILPLGERSLFIALTALSDMATLGVKPSGGRFTWQPVVRDHATGEPVDPDDPEHAAAAFTGRFCAAALARDRALQRDLFYAFLLPAARDEPDPAAEEDVADAFAMLTQLAVKGIARERVRRERTHHHPQARHRPNRRDQRRR
jgi:hypothetical protein